LPCGRLAKRRCPVNSPAGIFWGVHPIRFSASKSYTFQSAS
jgi:hypothetical protein